MIATGIFKTLSALALVVLMAGPLQANMGHKDWADEDKMMDKALDDLNLTGDQKEKLKEAREDHKAKMDAIVDKMNRQMDTLKTQVDNKATDSELKGTLDQCKDIKKEMMDEREKFHDKLEDILTPMQKAKMVLNMKSKMMKK